MRKPTQRADRWLRQAKHDLDIARRHLKESSYSDCCFMCEQTAQKSIKAYLFAQGERLVAEHSILGMAKRACEYDATFKSFFEQARVLDQYYIPTRYPDAIAEPAVPFESYTQEQAARAVSIAEELVELIKHKTGGS